MVHLVKLEINESANFTVNDRSVSSIKAKEFINDIAKLRIEVFREFPYLYEGTRGYEEKYLAKFFEADNSVIVLAIHNGNIVGVSTGLPLSEESVEIRAPFKEKGYLTEKFYYFSDSVLRKAFRGIGIGLEFFNQREKWVRHLKTYEKIVFCSVMREQDHPRRPMDYKPLNDFWNARGFNETNDLICRIAWQDLEEETETPKPLKFWMKKL